MQELDHPVLRGALIGLLASMETFGAGRAFQVADGAAIKRPFWNRELGPFLQLATERADCIVFIVPTHLRAIGVDSFCEAQYRLVVPAQWIHELWPSVLSTLAGQLMRIFERHRSVCILVQAGLMSAPIGALARHVASRQRTASVRCIDFGQLLDVAAPQEQGTGQWIRKPDVLATLRSQDIPLVLGTL